MYAHYIRTYEHFCVIYTNSWPLDLCIQLTFTRIIHNCIYNHLLRKILYKPQDTHLCITLAIN